MTAANFDLGWEALVAILGLLFVAGFLLLIVLLREPRSRRAHRLRVGLFVERDEEAGTEEDVPGPSEWPTRH